MLIMVSDSAFVTDPCSNACIDSLRDFASRRVLNRLLDLLLKVASPPCAPSATVAGGENTDSTFASSFTTVNPSVDSENSLPQKSSNVNIHFVYNFKW
jgi:hypothetical protein